MCNSSTMLGHTPGYIADCCLCQYSITTISINVTEWILEMTGDMAVAVLAILPRYWARNMWESCGDGDQAFDTTAVTVFRVPTLLLTKKSRTHMNNFPGSVRSPQMFKYKEKTAFNYNIQSVVHSRKFNMKQNVEVSCSEFR